MRCNLQNVEPRRAPPIKAGLFCIQYESGDYLNAQDAWNKILTAISIVVSQKVNQIPMTYYLDAKVTAANADGSFDITIGDDVYLAVKARDGVAPIVGNSVSICVRNGDLSRKFIDYIN